MRNHWKLGITFAFAVSVLTGCSSSAQPQTTNGAPPTVVCGTELSDSAAGPAVLDATRRLPTINYSTIGGVLIFIVARGCDQVSRVSWIPRSAARLVKAAYARDGQMAAVVLQPEGPSASFGLTGTRNGVVVAAATVKLAS